MGSVHILRREVAIDTGSRAVNHNQTNLSHRPSPFPSFSHYTLPYG